MQPLFRIPSRRAGSPIACRRPFYTLACLAMLLALVTVAAPPGMAQFTLGAVVNQRTDVSPDERYEIVTVFDTATDQIVREIPLESFSVGFGSKIAITRDGKYVYQTWEDHQSHAGVRRFNTATGQLDEIIPYPYFYIIGSAYNGPILAAPIALTWDDRYILLPNCRPHYEYPTGLAVVEVATGRLTGFLETRDCWGLAISSDGYVVEAEVTDPSIDALHKFRVGPGGELTDTGLTLSGRYWDVRLSPSGFGVAVPLVGGAAPLDHVFAFRLSDMTPTSSVQVTKKSDGNPAIAARAAFSRAGDRLYVRVNVTDPGFVAAYSFDKTTGLIGQTPLWYSADIHEASADSLETSADGSKLLLGTNYFKLRVLDSSDGSLLDPIDLSRIGTSFITIPHNGAPIADAGPDQTVTITPRRTTAQFTLDGSRSSDPDGDPLSFDWSEGGSPVGSGSTLSLSRPAGTYTFTLTVTDPYGASSSQDVHVTVNPPPSNGVGKKH